MIALALIAASIVTSVTVDVGPAIRTRAEKFVSVEIMRPTTMQGLSVRLFDGRLIARDLLIEGYDAEAQPFLKAREIQIGIPLWTLLRREIRLSSIEMTDWRMYVETFADGRHNVPHLSGRPSTGRPSRFTTNISYIHASRGEFSYWDSGTPWGTDLPDMDITVMNLGGYRGLLHTGRGVLRIQSYEPAWASFRSWFRIAGGQVLFDKIAIDTYGSTTIATGTADIAHWPEQTYTVESVLQLPQMREIFWAPYTFSLTGEAHFNGTFHMYKGGRILKGDFRGENPALNIFQFPNMEGSLVWTHERFDVVRSRSEFYGAFQRQPRDDLHGRGPQGLFRRHGLGWHSPRGTCHGIQPARLAVAALGGAPGTRLDHRRAAAERPSPDAGAAGPDSRSVDCPRVRRSVSAARQRARGRDGELRVRA